MNYATGTIIRFLANSFNFSAIFRELGGCADVFENSGKNNFSLILVVGISCLLFCVSLFITTPVPFLFALMNYAEKMFMQSKSRLFGFQQVL